MRRDTSNVPSAGFGVTVDIPLFDRNQGQIAVETATRQTLFDEYANRVFLANSDVAAAVQDIQSTNEQISASSEAIPGLESLVHSYQDVAFAGQLGCAQPLRGKKRADAKAPGEFETPTAVGAKLDCTGNRIRAVSTTEFRGIRFDRTFDARGPAVNALTRYLSIGLIVIGAAAGGFWFGHRSSAGDPEANDSATTQPAEEDKPVAEVRVTRARIDAISQTITAYGVVTAQAGNVSAVSVPYESHVVKVLVAGGQQVAAKTDVVQIEPSADTLTTLAEAKQTAAVAERDFTQTQQRFNDHLATNVDLSQAQQALDAARLKLAELTRRGIGAAQTMQSTVAGVVSKVDVQPGQTVPAGGSLLEITAGNQVEISLNVDPDDVSYLMPGQAVQLNAVNDSSAAPIAGQIRTIVRRIDPATRLASVLVSMPPDAHWMLETFVRGQIVKNSEKALLVPRDAVLPDEGGESVLFTGARWTRGQPQGEARAGERS